MASFKEATNTDIKDAFEEFHKKNPIVYTLFKEQCFRAIRMHRDKVSSKQIIGYLRWEASFQTDSKDDFKINDAYTSHYARLFAKEHPEYEDLFNFRELRASTDTHTHKFLTAYQENILKELVGNHIIKVGKTIHRTVSGSAATVPLDYVTFNRFMKIKYLKIQSGFFEDGAVIQYDLTDIALKYLSNLPPVAA